MNTFERKENIIKYLLPQTSLFNPIYEYGCNFRSLQAMAEIKTRHGLNYSEIEDLFSMAMNRKWIDNECYVKSPEDICNSVFKLYKSKYRVWNCGKVQNGEALSWKGHPVRFDYSIVKLYQPDMINKHFVLGDKNYDLVFDPYPNSKSVKLWNIKDIYLYSFYEA